MNWDWETDSVLLLDLFVEGYKTLSDKKSLGLYQSDTASVEVPELDLELASGTLGGVVTTVEGLITKISESE